MHIPTTLHRWKFLTVLCIGLLAASFSYSVFAAYNTDGLAGYWKFDETSTGTAQDVSGHNNNGTHVTGGGFGISTDVPTTSFTNTRSLSFDDDYVSVPDDASLDVTNITISFWVKPSGGAQTDGAAFVCKGNGAGGEVWCMDVNTSNFRFYFWKGGVAYTSVSTSTIGSDWKHVAATYDGSSAVLYIDGTAEDTDAHGVGNLDTNNHIVSIGARQSGSGDYDLEFDGYIDDVRVYNRALSSTEVTELANGNHTTAIWDGSSSTDFETAANWDISAVPDPYTHIIVPEQVGGAELGAAISGASLTIEASGFTGSYIDLHGFDFEFTDGGELKGGGTLRLLGSENIVSIGNLATTSTGTVLYYGTGSYTGLAAGDSYYNLNVNDGLVGYWDFDASEGGYVRDVSGYDADGVRASLPASPSFASTPAPTAFFNRYAMSFDGGDRVELNDGTPFRKSQYTGTVSAWVKTDNASSDQIIFWTEENRDRGLIIDGDDSAFAGVVYDGTAGQFRVASGGTVTTGWHHVAYTWDISRGAVRLFVDGVSVNTNAGASWTTAGNSNVNSNFGAYEGGGGDFTNDYNNLDGLLDDFRIYDRVLEDHEISALAAGHMPATASGSFTLDAALTVANDLTLAGGNLDVSGSNRSITLSGSWLNFGGAFTPRVGVISFEGASGDEEIRSGGQEFYQLHIEGGATWTLRDDLEAAASIRLNSGAGTLDASTDNYTMKTGFVSQSAGTITPQSGIIVLNATASKTATITSALHELQIEDPTENGLVGYWKFDECQTDETVDSSGNGNDGTLISQAVWTGSSLPTTVFANECALRLYGSNDYITMGDVADLEVEGSVPFSISVWLRPVSSLGTNLSYGLVTKGVPGVAGYAFQYENIADVYQINISKYGVVDQRVTIDELALNEWHHLVGVQRATEIEYYVNGVSQGTYSNASAYNASGTNEFRIGITASNTLDLPGFIDDVRVYDRALTADEVSRLANGYYADGQLGTAQFSLGADLDLDTLTILSGKVSASSRTIDVSGDWNNYAGSGAFIEGTSTVDFDGSSTQNIRGSTEFYNLEVSTSSAQTVKFGSGTTQFISNALTLTGQAGNLLTLAPITTATQWLIDLAGAASQTIQYVSVSYSNASGGEELDACPGGVDNGNNTNWNFNCDPSSNESSGGGWASNNLARQRAQGGSGDGYVAHNDTEAPTLIDVGIADNVVEETKRMVGGILDASMRGTVEPTELSRRVKQVAEALTKRFSMGIHAFREAQNQNAEQLQASAPQLDDTQRRMMRAERNIADNSIAKLTASAIGERRGLLVAQVQSEEVVYADVPVDSWFAPFVSSVIEEDIATGYADEEGKPTGEFGVKNPVTYAEILKMALKTSGKDISIGVPRNVSAQGTWASAYVAYAEEKALKVFAPDLDVHSPATRGEMVQIILEILELPIANQAPSFTDVPANHPYAHAIATASFYGIISGDTDNNGNSLNTFRPDEQINRAEVVKVVALLQALQK